MSIQRKLKEVKDVIALPPNFFDKYTQMDDLLRSMVTQQLVTNKLLFELVHGLIDKETMPFSQNLQIDFQNLQKNMIVSSQEWRSIFVSWESISNTVIPLLDIKGTGVLAELMLLSDVASADNGVYKVQIKVDGQDAYNRTRAQLASVSDYHADMTVDTDASYYISTFQNIAFRDSIYLRVYESSATFTQIMLKYHIKE